MNKKSIITLIVFLGLSLSAFAEDITGFWQTINKNNGKTSSVIAVYSYEGMYYGRIIATYDRNGVLNDTIYKPLDRAMGLAGDPYYCGLDIVWTNPPEKEGGKKYKGQVINPDNGKVYTAKLWRDEDNLILRGEVFIFGKNVTWPKFEDFTEEFKKPDLSTFVPNVPEGK